MGHVANEALLVPIRNKMIQYRSIRNHRRQTGMRSTVHKLFDTYIGVEEISYKA